MVSIEVPLRNSSGCLSSLITFQIFTGRAPFYGTTPTATAVGVLAGRRPPRPSHQDLSDYLWGTIQRCWSQEPRDRPDISRVLSCLQTAALRHDQVNDNLKNGEAQRSDRERELSIGETLSMFFSGERVLTVIERISFPAVPMATHFLCLTTAGKFTFHPTLDFRCEGKRRRSFRVPRE